MNPATNDEGAKLTDGQQLREVRSGPAARVASRRLSCRRKLAPPASGFSSPKDTEKQAYALRNHCDFAGGLFFHNVPRHLLNIVFGIRYIRGDQVRCGMPQKHLNGRQGKIALHQLNRPRFAQNFRSAQLLGDAAGFSPFIKLPLTKPGSTWNVSRVLFFDNRSVMRMRISWPSFTDTCTLRWGQLESPSAGSE
jgi:hypothetical protein